MYILTPYSNNENHQAMEAAAAGARQQAEGHKQELLEARRALALARANAQEAAQRSKVQETVLEDRNVVIQGRPVCVCFGVSLWMDRWEGGWAHGDDGLKNGYIYI